MEPVIAHGRDNARGGRFQALQADCKRAQVVRNMQEMCEKLNAYSGDGNVLANAFFYPFSLFLLPGQAESSRLPWSDGGSRGSRR